jgi:hypothetical protein
VLVAIIGTDVQPQHLSAQDEKHVFTVLQTLPLPRYLLELRGLVLYGLAVVSQWTFSEDSHDSSGAGGLEVSGICLRSVLLLHR